MFCPACGKSQSEDASFCEACGVKLLDRAEESDPNVLTEVLPIENDEEKGDGEEQPGEFTKSGHRKPSFGSIALIAAVILAVLAIAVALIVYSIPPELSEEEIIASFDQAALASNLSVVDQWAEKSDFAVSSIAVDSVEESKQQDQTYRIANVTIVSESTSFRIVSVYRCVYVLQDRTWRLDDSSEMSRSIDPVNGVDDDAVIERMPTFIEQVDEKPYKDAKGKKHYLKTLYKENTTFSVLENNTAPSGGAVKVSMKTSSGLLSYSAY